MNISAYTKNDKIVEGKIESFNGNKVVMTESGPINIKSLKCIRLYEEDESDVDKQVKSDIDVIKKSLETKKPKEDELEKAGEERAKELSNAGLKEKEPDEYKTKFVLQASAIVGGANSGVDLEKSDANKSNAFKGLTESEDLDVENDNLHSDYQSVQPYQDTLTRDQIYLKMQQEIDNYKPDTAEGFQESVLIKRMCDHLIGYDCTADCKTLKESFMKIRKAMLEK